MPQEEIERGVPVTEWGLERHFRRNLAAVSCWEIFWGFGAACVSSSIVMAFLTHITESKTLIGALSLTNLLELPALFATTYLNRQLRQKKRFVAGVWAVQVLNWIVLGAYIAMSNSNVSAYLIVLFFAVYSIIHIVTGLVTAPTYELLFGVFGNRRGTVQGVQLLCNRALGVLGGLFAATVLDQYSFPVNFGLTFLVGGIFLTASNTSVLAMIEPPTYGEWNNLQFGAYIKSLAKTVTGHREFVVFTQVIGFLSFIAMAQGFYVVYVLERLRLSSAYAGLFTTIAFAAEALGGIVAGALGDRFGHRRLLLGGLSLHLASLLAVLVMQSPTEFYVALALRSIATVAEGISTTNLNAKLAPAGERGGYIAVTRIMSHLATALSTLLGGILIDSVGYSTVFALTLAFPVAAIALTLRLHEPRV